MIRRLPPGWSVEQLTLLNDFLDLANAHRTIRDVMALTGDTSPLAVRVRDDVAGEALAVWAQIKATVTG